MIPKTQGFLFDMDGVVIDSEFFRDVATTNLLASHGIIYDRDLIKPQLSGKSSIKCMEIIVAHYGMKISAKDLDDSRREEIKRLYREEIPFVPGFLELYHVLNEEYNLPSAIATGCDEDFFSAVDTRLGITALFHNHVYRADMVKRPKPHPDIFQYAAEKIGVPVENCIVIEDAPSGIAAGLSAGCRVVALTRTFNESILHNSLINLLGVNYKKDDILYIPDFTENSNARFLEFAFSK